MQNAYKIVRCGKPLSTHAAQMRTDQPDYAPEIDTIRDFDINDYKTKSELTRRKLYATVTAAIRA